MPRAGTTPEIHSTHVASRRELGDIHQRNGTERDGKEGNSVGSKVVITRSNRTASPFIYLLFTAS